MPSRYEPCGLNQIYSLRYGTLPIVRATGGLDDTVPQDAETNGAGTGFKFWEPSPQAIYYATGWAISTYFDRPMHMVKMIRTAMRQDYSWERSAGGNTCACTKRRWQINNSMGSQSYSICSLHRPGGRAPHRVDRWDWHKSVTGSPTSLSSGRSIWA